MVAPRVVQLPPVLPVWRWRSLLPEWCGFTYGFSHFPSGQHQLPLIFTPALATVRGFSFDCCFHATVKNILARVKKVLGLF